MPWLALVARTAHHTRDTAALTCPRLALVGLAAIEVAVARQAFAIFLAWVPIVSVGTPVTTRTCVTILAFAYKPSTCLSVARLGKILTCGRTLTWQAGLSIHGVSEESGRTNVAPSSSGVLATILAKARVRIAAVCSAIAHTGQRLPNQVDDDLTLHKALLVVAVVASARVLTGGAGVFLWTFAHLHTKGLPRSCFASRSCNIETDSVKLGHCCVRGFSCTH